MNFLEIFPKQIVVEIFQYFTVNEIYNCGLINKYSQNLIFNSSYGNMLWRKMVNAKMGYEMTEKDVLEYQNPCITNSKDTNQFWSTVYRNIFQFAWNEDCKGKTITISPDKRSFSYGPFYKSWNCILSVQNFSQGIHFLEFKLDKVSSGGYIFFGLGDNRKIPLDGCIGGSESCIVSGYDDRLSHQYHSAVKHNSKHICGKLNKPKFIGLLIDMEKLELSYCLEDDLEPVLAFSNIFKNAHIFACVATDTIVTFCKQITGELNIKNYLKHRRSFLDKYIPSEFVISKN
eukprot:TRINITY_DN6232_c0_g1_i1.p1 TRINITY_DN6232_c0_g1~~TRINITY_DN6232_c0_g1_i1.p1  ORF type:complete len:288 (-),score=41.27 TRINITY_DN6232_c0_g1_i1:206-1069(-)